MSLCPIGVFASVYLSKIALMIILAISIYVVYHKTIIKFTDKCLINKSVYPIRLFTTTTGKSYLKITFVIFLSQLSSASYIKYSAIV